MEGGLQNGHAVLVFGFVNPRAASKDCRFAVRALDACGWSARRILKDRKARAPSDAPLSRQDSVSSSSKD